MVYASADCIRDLRVGNTYRTRSLDGNSRGWEFLVVVITLVAFVQWATKEDPRVADFILSESEEEDEPDTKQTVGQKIGLFTVMGMVILWATSRKH